MRATDDLKSEHQGIELMLTILQTIAGKIGEGEQIGSGQLDSIMEFLSIFVDKCHHAKEEEFLFPALEAAGVPREGGPIGVLLGEHEQGRRLVARLKKAVTNYTSGDKTAAANVQVIVDEYVALLTQHIEKETNVLFAMADAKLDTAKDNELFEAFEQLEKERIGLGKHEEFHALLHRLEHEYVG